MPKVAFPLPSGLWIVVWGSPLQLARSTSRWQIWRFENALRAGEVKDGFDAVFVPKSSHVTGDIDCHEMAIDGDGRLVFVNTLFNCISYLSRDYSFHPVWRPDFISDYVPEDRCHLNGLAMEDGRPAYVTAISKSNEADGWRKERADGGVIIDVRSNEIVCDGLSMPHSPRMHGRTLWVLDSGTGYLGRVDLDMKTFEPVTLCPGYLRGMTIVGNCAVVCISKARDSENFGDLALQENLDAHKTEAYFALVAHRRRRHGIVWRCSAPRYQAAQCGRLSVRRHRTHHQSAAGIGLNHCARRVTA